MELQDGYPAAATAPSVIVAEAPDANILKTRTYVSEIEIAVELGGDVQCIL